MLPETLEKYLSGALKSVPQDEAASSYEPMLTKEMGMIDWTMSAEEICDAMIEQFTTMSFDGITGEGMTWAADGTVSKSPKGMVISGGAYVGLD